MTHTKLAALVIGGAVPFLIQCKDKVEVKVSDIYPIPTCAEGEYYDGIAGACVAQVKAISLGDSFKSYRDVDFGNRKAQLEAFITNYFTQELPDHTFAVAPTCTEELEYKYDYNEAFYVRNASSFNCLFTLKKGEETVLEYKENTVTEVVTVPEDTDPPKYDEKYLKVVHTIDDDNVKLMECGYGLKAVKTEEKDDLYNPSTSKTEFNVQPNGCVDLGTRPIIPESLRGKDAKIIAFPASFNEYLRGERTSNTVGGQKIYTYADARFGSINQLAVNCNNETFTIPVSLTADADTPKRGTLTLGSLGDEFAFFGSNPIKGKDGFDYLKARKIFGCTETKCLTDGKFTYDFFGDYLIVNAKVKVGGKSTTTREIWRVIDGSGTLAFGSRDANGNANKVCDFTYTNTKS